MYILSQTVCLKPQTSKDFRRNKKIERSAFIRKNILSRDCQSHEAVPSLVPILCVFQQLASVPRKVQVKSKNQGQLTIQGDEM
ncbi:hypothetical protein D0A34_25165 [Microcoleus vaginatus PCC 9802]|nr:hypothetical protein D0A34_25165 [Microcoleus vaginatus PCC 9802]